MTTPPALEQVKARTRATWAAGDFAAIARRQLWPVGAHIVQRVGVGRGERVLDVACGTGNAAIRAAQAGGQVTGVDLTPELFAAARREAAAAGVSIEWVEGDAEALPFPDAGFDVVLSTFGVMFAPRHRVAAAELVRVLRPGGRFALTTWTPGGSTGAMFRTMGRYLPVPPPFVEPPLLWGSPDHVREIFADTDAVLEFETATVTAEPFASGEEAFAFSAETFGPMIMARQMLEEGGRWDALRADVVALYDPDEPAEYLVVLGRRPE